MFSRFIFRLSLGVLLASAFLPAQAEIVPAAEGSVGPEAFAGAAGSIPEGWHWGVSGDAQCRGALDGQGVFQVRNDSPAGPNVYGSLQRSFKLTPGASYIIRLRARGDGQPPLIAIGTGWHLRFPIGFLTSEWRTYSLPFRAPEVQETDGNGLTPVVIIFEHPTAGIDLSGFSLQPAVKPKLETGEWQRNLVYGVREVKEDFATVEAIPAGLPVLRIPAGAANTEAGTVPDASDLSAEIALGCDAGGLLFFARVADDAVNLHEEEEMWKGDSVQLRIDRAAGRFFEAATTDLEVGFAVGLDGRVSNWCWDAGRDPTAGKPLPDSLCSAHGFRSDGGYFIAARLDWKLWEGIRPEPDRFGFTVVVNDSDRPEQRAVYFLTPGLHDRKASEPYVQALLATGAPMAWAAVPNDSRGARSLRGALAAAGLEGDLRFTAEMTDRNGRKVVRALGEVSGVQPGDLLKLPFDIALDELADGDYTVDFMIDGRSVERIAASKTDLYQEQTGAVALLVAELARLNRAFDAHYGEGPRSDYVAVPLGILNFHLPRLAGNLANASNDDIRRYYAEQAAMTHADIAGTLTDLELALTALREGRQLPAGWRYQSSDIRLVDGWPVALAKNDRGETAERPVVCVGYGHFSDIDRDIARFQDLGANVVQVEIGPNSFYPREGRQREFEADFTEFEERILPLMQEAWENNVKIALLISPHYHPDWLLDKYPDMKAVSMSHFLKYEVTHPKSLELFRDFIPAIVGRLRSSPYAGAIHSICLSNEPVYNNCTPGNPYSVAMFSRRMLEKYGPVGNFNALARRNFGSYEEVAASTGNDKAAKFAFYSFAKETFADWHRFLAEEVKKVWPEIPVHTKIMVFSSTFEYDSGIDPELLAAFCDYNGNDNCFYPGGRWQAGWNVPALTHEIQISSRPVSVANTENHIIVDRETRPIANDHIYTALFQQYVTGVSTMTTWVYADIDYDFVRENPRHDFIGDIYLRPGNLAAHARAEMDGMRLAPELRKFMQAEPEVALLYAPTSVLLDPGVYRTRLDALYSLLSFTGYRPRTLSERQLAAGEFGKTAVLYVTGAANVSRAALDGMAEFVKRGGRIVADGKSLREDEFGNPIEPVFPVEAMAELTVPALTAQIHRTVAPLPVRVMVEEESGNDGVFFRMVPDGGGGWLVNLVNYNAEPRRLTLDADGEWVDLIGEKAFNPSFSLAPLKPQLLRFIPAQTR